MIMAYVCCGICRWVLCFLQAEDGIRDLVRSRGLGDVYKRQGVKVDDADLVVDAVHRRLVQTKVFGQRMQVFGLSLIHI